jgi:membrane protein YqaA with SNARE-associated domain
MQTHGSRLFSSAAGDAMVDSAGMLEAAERDKPIGGTVARPNALRRLYDWCLSWADSRFGTPALAAMSFAEASFFPIPPDVLQIGLSVAKPKRSLYYAAVSAVASVAGAILGWMIGKWFWGNCCYLFYDYVPGITEERFNYVADWYGSRAFWAILISAFTPIPFKVFTIASGACGVGLGELILASAIGRSARFFLVGGTIYAFGPKVKELLEKYFNLATVILVVLLIGGFLVMKYVAPVLHR